MMSLLLRRIHREEEVNKILGLKNPTPRSLNDNINNTQCFVWLNLSPRIRQAYAQFASGETLPQIPAVTLPFLSILYGTCACDNWSEDSNLGQGQCLKFLEIPLLFDLTFLWSFGLAHQHWYNLIFWTCSTRKLLQAARGHGGPWPFEQARLPDAMAAIGVSGWAAGSNVLVLRQSLGDYCFNETG